MSYISKNLLIVREQWRGNQK